ncbi:MAG: hypothetical protein JWP03_1874 [Phycisphaerales bacterium]|jgi:hypothetical protein|nr:hypothetical protein [Phycisphaerales bacterium]
MDKNVEQLLITAGKMMGEDDGGSDWQAVVKGSHVPEDVASRLVSQGLLKAHIVVGHASASTGLEDWHLTPTAKEMVSELMLAEAQQPRRFGGKGWSRKPKGPGR